MAGAGYKLFNTGDVLTAAQVNTYLQEQVVMVFADAAARTTALSGVLAEGMVSYLKDTDALEIYSGAAWVGYGSGDITAVVAGTGLSGGATSGSATLSLTIPVAETNGGTNQTTYTTGDLLYASGTNTLSKRAIGTTGQVLTVSGGIPTWANAAGGGGKVLQVVYGSTATAASSSTTTYADTNLSASITPSATSSKVLVLVSQNGCRKNTGNVDSGLNLKLLRGSTDLITFCESGGFTETNLFNHFGTAGVAYLDSPSTTSSTTYKTQFANRTSAASVSVQVNSNQSSTIILLEIGA